MSNAMNPDTSSPAPSGAASPASSVPPEVWGMDLEAVAPGQTSWLWDGYLARGNVTLLTSLWKTGKTTLLSVLLARREAGGELAGLALAPGRTAVVSEESAVLWNERRRKLGFGPSAAFLCRPFPCKPTTAQWLALIDRLGELHDRAGVDLAVIDPLASFLPGRGENSSDLMYEALLPLRRLTGLGMGVLLLHHPGKDKPAEGQAARGSGALPAHVDVIVEMHPCRHAAADDRRRVLYGRSRFDATPRERVIELNAEGTDYRVLGSLPDLEFEQTWERLRGLFEAAHAKQTKVEVLARWSEARESAAETTLRRWLDEAVARGLLLREGAGHKGAPYRYWLPGQEQKWQSDPLHELHELIFRDGRMMDETFGR